MYEDADECAEAMEAMAIEQEESEERYRDFLDAVESWAEREAEYQTSDYDSGDSHHELVNELGIKVSDVRERDEKGLLAHCSDNAIAFALQWAAWEMRPSFMSTRFDDGVTLDYFGVSDELEIELGTWMFEDMNLSVEEIADFARRANQEHDLCIRFHGGIPHVYHYIGIGHAWVAVLTIDTVENYEEDEGD